MIKNSFVEESANKNTEYFLPFCFQLMRVVIKAALKKRIISSNLFTNLTIGLDYAIDKTTKNPEIILKNYADSAYKIIIKIMSEEIKDSAYTMLSLMTEEEYEATTMRMWCSDTINSLQDIISDIITVITEKAKKFTKAVMPSMLYNTNGQVISFGYLLMSYAAMFERDKKRLMDVQKNVSILPLGSGLGAGNIICINYKAIAKSINFSSKVNNALDMITNREFVFEFVSTLLLCYEHIAKIASDILYLQNPHINFISLNENILSKDCYSDANRYPKIVELIRSKYSSVYGCFSNIISVTRNITSGISFDLNEFKSPMIEAYNITVCGFEMLTVVLEKIKVNDKKMKKSSHNTHGRMIDIINILMKQNMINYCEAVVIAKKIGDYSKEYGKKLSLIGLNELNAITSCVINSDIYSVLSTSRVIMQRRSTGGTNAVQIHKSIENIDSIK